jgi:ADP-ribosylglycohydrolase
MRAAPLGVLFGTDDRALLRAAREQSLITHLDSRCAAGSLAVAGAVSLAVARYPVEDEQFLRAVADLAATADQSVATAILNLRGWSHLPPPEAARRLHAERLDPDYADAWRGVSAYVIPSVLWSLYAFVRTPDDYWTTLCTAIGVGGDTDTMAAIAGAISGARLGPGALPAPLVRRVHDRDGWGFEQLMDLARRAARLIEA